MVCIKINDFLNKIGTIWALWAHMGPNLDRAPTRTGPQPGPGPRLGPRFPGQGGRWAQGIMHFAGSDLLVNFERFGIISIRLARC